jgi:hypothetical protein
MSGDFSGRLHGTWILLAGVWIRLDTQDDVNFSISPHVLSLLQVSVVSDALLSFDGAAAALTALDEHLVCGP